MVGIDYFLEFFSTSLPTDMDATLRYIKNKVSAPKNGILTAELSEQEIKKARFDINPDKASGPDIIQLVKEFFIDGSFDRDLTKPTFA